MAASTKTPELALSQTEGKELADAIQKVAEFHEIKIDPKRAAYVQLSICAGSIYLPRFVGMWKRHMKESPRVEAPEPKATPTPINRPSPPTQKPVSQMSPSELFGDAQGSAAV